MQEVKKGNWWQRKTKEQKTSFVFAAIIFVISLVGFILLMNARAFVSKEICDSFYGEGVANGWIALGKILAEGSAKWFVSIVFLFMAITLIFIATFVTHLFDSKSRKAKTVSSLVRSIIKYVTIIALICVILVVWVLFSIFYLAVFHAAYWHLVSFLHTVC